MDDSGIQYWQTVGQWEQDPEYEAWIEAQRAEELNFMDEQLEEA